MRFTFVIMNIYYENEDFLPSIGFLPKQHKKQCEVVTMIFSRNLTYGLFAITAMYSAISNLMFRCCHVWMAPVWQYDSGDVLALRVGCSHVSGHFMRHDGSVTLTWGRT